MLETGKRGQSKFNILLKLGITSSALISVAVYFLPMTSLTESGTELLRDLISKPLASSATLTPGAPAYAAHESPGPGSALTLRTYFVTPEFYGVNVDRVSKTDVDEAFKVFPQDEDGIPRVVYGGYAEPQYNPVTISNFALANWNVFVETGDESARRDFLNQANWLAENARKDEANKVLYWDYQFDNPAFGAKAPWRSAMAQGLALSVFIRAYQMTSDQAYLDLAEQAMRSFTIKISEGGITDVDDGYRYYEEVAVEPASHILNGFIFSIIGLHEYYLLTGDGTSEWLFNEGVKTIKHRLPDYLKYGGSYDLKLGQHFLEGKKPAVPKYQRIHQLQLEYLYEITKDKEFLKYSKLLNQQNGATTFLNGK